MARSGGFLSRRNTHAELRASASRRPGTPTPSSNTRVLGAGRSETSSVGGQPSVGGAAVVGRETGGWRDTIGGREAVGGRDVGGRDVAGRQHLGGRAAAGGGRASAPARLPAEGVGRPVQRGRGWVAWGGLQHSRRNVLGSERLPRGDRSGWH